MIEENRAEFERCRITDYHAAGKLGQGMTIAVLDDNEKPLPFMDYVEFPFGWFEKTNQHHSTKVIRVLHEVAPKARIISLPYIGPATTEDKRASIQWLMDNRERIDIINCSFHEWENDIFKQLKKLDIPIVCAAGNSGRDSKISHPARYEWAVGVGALEEYRDMVAGYSNAGPEIDCLGYTKIFIPTTKPDRPMEFEGTSAAAPMVAGMLALVGKMSGRGAKEFIKQNCIDYYDEGHDWRSGYGLFVLPEPGEKEAGKMAYIKDHIPKNSIKRTGGKTEHTSITIHSTGNPRSTARNERDWLTNSSNTSTTGWHIVVDDKEIIEAIPLDEIAYHAGNKNGNYTSIGIELCESGDRGLVIANAIDLVVMMLKDRNWGTNRLKRHYDWSGKACPMIMMDNDWQLWKSFVAEVERRLGNVAGFEGPAKVEYQGKELNAGILDGTTYVGVRELAGMLGLKVGWDNATKTVTLSK